MSVAAEAESNLVLNDGTTHFLPCHELFRGASLDYRRSSGLLACAHRACHAHSSALNIPESFGGQMHRFLSPLVTEQVSVTQQLLPFDVGAASNQYLFGCCLPCDSRLPERHLVCLSVRVLFLCNDSS